MPQHITAVFLKENEMTISQIKIKFLGKTEIIFRAMSNGQAVQAFSTKAEAESWIAANQ